MMHKYHLKIGWFFLFIVLVVSTPVYSTRIFVLYLILVLGLSYALEVSVRRIIVQYFKAVPVLVCVVAGVFLSSINNHHALIYWNNFLKTSVAIVAVLILIDTTGILRKEPCTKHDIYMISLAGAVLLTIRLSNG